jgi:HD-GYP domain-containing protein (c-di-GMP phosphodiesterase class II)
VCILALVFGRHLEMSEDELNLLGVGALLHDVGKMKIPTDVLNKPGKLTDEEFEIMKSHVPEGLKIVEGASGIHPLSLEVVARHHERYCGRGYIMGLTGDDIRPFGLISAIVDCYDAITSDRVYHIGMTAYEALTKMYEWRTSDFHPGLVEQYIQCMGIYPIGSLVEMNTGAIGVVITINRERRLLPKVLLILNCDKTPYTKPKSVDLMHDAYDSRGVKLEISKILPSGTHGVMPSKYLPIHGL